MTASTRNFLIASTVITISGLGVGLMAYYGGGGAARAMAVGPPELAYIPSDASAIGYANVRDIMNSEFRQRLQDVLPTGEERDRIETELGINFETDIDSIVAGFSVSDQPQDSAVLLVRGRFNLGHLEATAVQHGAVSSEYRGRKFLTGADHQVDGQRFEGGVAFLEEGNLIGIGEVDALRRAIDARETSASIVGNEEMMRFVGDLDALSHAWIVGHFDAVSQSAALPAEIRDRIPPVEWVAASARVNGGMNASLRAEARDEESAVQLRDAVRGFIAMGQMMSGGDARLEAMLKSIQVGGAGTNVTLSFAVTPELLDVINGVSGGLSDLGLGR